MRSRVIKRLRERVGLFGKEVGFANYRSVFVEMGSLAVDGRRLFVNGFYNCCAFDSNFADDNGFGSMMMMLLGASKL